MQKRWFKMIGIIGLVGLVLLIATLPVMASSIEERRTVPLETAESARVEIQFGVGELLVSGGAMELIEAEFRYANEHWEPELEHIRRNSLTRVEIDQDLSVLSFFHFGPLENRWNILLNNQVPLDLTVKVGAGKADLSMGWLNLRSLNIKVGAGEMILDLTGAWAQDCNIELDMAAGTLHLLLPSAVGVRVEAQTVVGQVDARNLTEEDGAYVNLAYHTSPVTLNIRLRNIVGEVVIKG
ncbi:MAG TPA: toast rack family protein [Atribacteraceae bacterium]|nr:toast rack family protein [Atribacteraceae bacterium]